MTLKSLQEAEPGGGDFQMEFTSIHHHPRMRDFSFLSFELVPSTKKKHLQKTFTQPLLLTPPKNYPGPLELVPSPKPLFTPVNLANT